MIPITIITEDNSIIPHMIPEDDNEKLDAIYLLMKCKLVQVVPTYECNQTLMLADEEGLLVGKAQNQLASILTGTVLVGRICIINQKHFQ